MFLPVNLWRNRGLAIVDVVPLVLIEEGSSFFVLFLGLLTSFSLQKVKCI